MENENELAHRTYVKVRDIFTGEVEEVASFPEYEAAENYCSKLITGAGGLFGLSYEVFTSKQPEPKAPSNQ